jgi:SNF2 family DNA or RNA helicase
MAGDYWENHMVYHFGTKPMAHQKEAFDRFKDSDFYALLMEQGTGKTKTEIDITAYKWEKRSAGIEGLIVIGPSESDVPANWIDQLAIHIPKRINYLAVRAGTHMKAEQKRTLKLILDPKYARHRGEPFLRIITTNIEAIRAGSPLFKQLLTFCRQFRVKITIDESTRIKSNSSSQTKAALKLGNNAVCRSIDTGTLLGNGSPLDAFPQFEFLKPGLLGFDSYVAYKAHYCELLPPEHGIVRYTAEKMAAKIRDPQAKAAFTRKMTSIIQLPKRDAMGRVIYRNQEDLAKKIAKYSYRKTKEECLDLPPKIYAPKRIIPLTDKQREIYDEVRKRVVAEFIHDQELHQITLQLAITRLLRLQQVLCNHFSPDPDYDEPKQPPTRIEPATRDKKGKLVINNPRMIDLLAWIEEAGYKRKGIIWCRHHPEIREIVETLSELFGEDKVVQLHGLVKGEARIQARKRFQDRKDPSRWIIGQIRSGIGIDLYEAWWEYYYSNSYSLEDRKQSEDRAHRKGLEHPVTIGDAVVPGTVDERIILSLRDKQEISELILGDNPTTWI